MFLPEPPPFLPCTFPLLPWWAGFLNAKDFASLGVLVLFSKKEFILTSFKVTFKVLSARQTKCGQLVLVELESCIPYDPICLNRQFGSPTKRWHTASSAIDIMSFTLLCSRTWLHYASCSQWTRFPTISTYARSMMMNWLAINLFYTRTTDNFFCLVTFKDSATSLKDMPHYCLSSCSYYPSHTMMFYSNITLRWWQDTLAKPLHKLKACE